MRSHLLLMTIGVVLSCACGDEAVTPASVGPSVSSANPTHRLLRASMLLRGTRPSLEEYRRVSQPGQYALIVDEYLSSAAFGATVRQLATEWLELDQAPDAYPAGFPALGALEGLGTHELNTSLIQAAGRLAEHIVMSGRPWTEFVTADYTLADRTVSEVWGLPYDAEVGGWQVTRYVDGRPDAGVLSDGWLFTRMPSTEGNRHRERASLIANSLICHDYPNRPVRIPPDVDLTSEDAIANAVETNAVCQSCHHSMDPLASFFAAHYALRIPEYVTEYPLEQYTPEATAGFEAPSWYGQPGQDLADLGQFIADDPRFSACMVRHVYSEMMHVDIDDVPIVAINRYQPQFREDFDMRALFRAMVLSDEFGANSVITETGETLIDPLDVGVRRATPQQLDSLFLDLTGYQWRAIVPFDIGSGPIGEVPLLRDPLFGYRTMGGGPNGFDTTAHLRTVNATSLLVLNALAERAARHVVASDTNPSTARLLTVEGAISGEPAAVLTQLQLLHLRLFGDELEPDAPALLRSQALWEAASDDPARAWEVTLCALFQDPRILLF